MGRTAPSLAVALGLVLTGVPSPSGAADAHPGRGLFEARCTTCHPGDRSLRKRKNPEGWSKTVRRMKRYAAGKISDEEADAILDYLVRVRGPEG